MDNEKLDIINLSTADSVSHLFDPRILDGEKDIQQVWTSESVELARNGLVQGYKLKANPFLKNVKDVFLRKANLPFKMSEDEEWVYEKCFLDKVFFANNFTSLKDAQHGWRRITLRDYQERLLENYSKNRWNIVLYPRQSGKTTTTVLDIAHFLTFNIDKDCVVIAQSERVVLEILAKIKEVFASMPFFLQPGFLKFTKTGCVLDNGCRLFVGVASESVVQGFALDYVFIDEMAYIGTGQSSSKARKFWNNIYPTLANNPQSKCTIASTPNGRNLFWELWNNAVLKKNKFVTNRVYWTDVPGRDEQFKRDTIENVGLEGWLMGFECSFDTQLSSIFTTKTQRYLREEQAKAEPKNTTENQSEGYWSKSNHYLGEHFDISFINQEIISYDTMNDYFMFGIDISEGLEQDYTTIKIRKLDWDTEKKQIVYKSIGVYKNNTISVEDFAEMTMQLFSHFDNRKIKVCVDLTNYGNEYFAHINKLRLYDKRYYSFDNVVFARYESTTKKDYEIGCRWNKYNKKIGVRALTGLVNNRIFIESHSETIEEYLNFGKNTNDSYSAQYGHDDLIMADILISNFVKSNNLYANEFLNNITYHLRFTYNDLTEEQLQLLERETKDTQIVIDGMVLRSHNDGYVQNKHAVKSKLKYMEGSLSLNNYTKFSIDGRPNYQNKSMSSRRRVSKFDSDYFK